MVLHLPKISQGHSNCERTLHGPPKKLRGPFPIEVLAEATGISVDQIRTYQSQDLIPQRRPWHPQGEAMFYKVDIQKIEYMLAKRDNINIVK